MHKAVLFDMDGVLSLHEELFSVIYTRTMGYDIAPFTKFFETEWSDFVTGKQDLKEHIKNHPGLWKWDKSPDELLRYWFESQNSRNEALLDIIHVLRSRGIPCYIATEQEKYRTTYIRDVVFLHDVDGVFSTADIGFKKNDVRFYSSILKSLSIVPSELLFFDDSQSKIDTAKTLGIDAHLYEDVEQVGRLTRSDD